MSQSIITLAAEEWLANKVAAHQPARPDKMVFAHIPEQDAATPIQPDEGMPPADAIKHMADITQFGLLNENTFVSSVILDSTIGDWTYNWVGLIDSESNTVLMIVHVADQQKIKTQNGIQGNTLTRNLAMQFSGAADASHITVTAETWQIDYSARLIGIDERLRVANQDIYGKAAFFGEGYLVTKHEQGFHVTPGAGYVHGLRCEQGQIVTLMPESLPTRVWLDASLQGTVTSRWEVVTQVTTAPERSHYTQNGFSHFVFAIADIAADGTVTDLRPKGPTQQQDDKLARHEKSRNHPDATLAEKGFVQLSSELDSNSEMLAATPKAVKIAMDNARARLAKDRNGADIPIPALFVDNLGLRDTVNKAASALQDGSWGIGANGISMTNNDILSPTSIGNTFFNQGGGASDSHFGGYGTGIHLSYGSSGDGSQRMTANLFVDSAGNLSVEWLAVNKSNSNIVVQRIQKLYGPLNKPSAGDVSAIPFFGQIPAGTNLNTLTNYGVWFNPANANATPELNYPSWQAGSLQVLQDAGTAQIYTEYAGGKQYRRGLYDGRWSAWRVVYDSLNKQNSDDVNAISRDTCHVAGFVNGNKEVPYMRHTTSNEVISLLTTSAAAARYVSDIRMGANSYVDWGSGGGTVPAGCVLTGGNFDDARSRAFYAPVQKCVNGTWYNVVRV